MLDNGIDPILSLRTVKIRLAYSKHIQVPLLLVINIMNSLSLLQLTTTKKTFRALSLAINPVGVSMSLNISPTIGIRIHLTYTTLLIWFNHTPIISDKVYQ